MVLCLDRTCQCGLYSVIWLHIGNLCAVSLLNLPVPPDFHSLLNVPLAGTVFLIPWDTSVPHHSIVWDWRVSRAGPMLFYFPKLLYPYYCLLLFFLSLLSVYRLVLWGWGLRTDKVYITLSQPRTTDLF